MAINWILVACASHVDIYVKDELHKKPHLIKRLQHPAGKYQPRDFVPDSLDHNKGPKITPHAFVDIEKPKQTELKRFGKKIVHELEKAKNSHQFDKFILVAEPHFSGILGKFIEKTMLKNYLNQIIPKHYTDLPEKVLIKKLEEQLINDYSDNHVIS